MTAFFTLAVAFALTAVSVFGQTNKEETINIDSMLINNNVPFLTTVKVLKDNLGKPDSIVSKPKNFGNYVEVATDPIYFYGQTSFEIHNETAVLQKIDFRNEQFKLNTTGLTLDSHTTLNDFRQFFPSSSDKSYDWTNPIDKKTYKLVRVQSKENHIDQWVLKFYNDKLIEIEYRTAC